MDFYFTGKNRMERLEWFEGIEGLGFLEVFVKPGEKTLL